MFKCTIFNTRYPFRDNNSLKVAAIFECEFTYYLDILRNDSCTATKYQFAVGGIDDCVTTISRVIVRIVFVNNNRNDFWAIVESVFLN